MAGPEEASQGNNGLLREILSVVKAMRTAVSGISDIKSKVSEIENPSKTCCLPAVLLCYVLVSHQRKMRRRSKSKYPSS
jgi:hypothetical protein